MSEWKEYRLNELILINAKSIDRNYPHKEIEYLDTGSITRSKIEDLQSFELENAPSRAKRLVKDNDIIYSTVRPIQRHYGMVKNPKSNLVVSTGFVVLSCDEKRANSKFIYYFLTSDEIVNYLDMVAEGSTSAYPSLTPDVIADMDILLPPLPEQKRIAAILNEQMAAVENARAAAEARLEAAKALPAAQAGHGRLPRIPNSATHITSRCWAILSPWHHRALWWDRQSPWQFP